MVSGNDGVCGLHDSDGYEHTDVKIGMFFLFPFLFIFNREITHKPFLRACGDMGQSPTIYTRIHHIRGQGNEKSEHNRKGKGAESWI